MCFLLRVKLMNLFDVEEWVNPSKLTQQIRLHHFTRGTSIPKPLRVWPEMPAASAVSLTNPNPVLHRYPEPGAWKVLALHQPQVNVLLQ